MDKPPSPKDPSLNPEHAMASAQFSVGDVVKHQMFDYYGIIYDVDPYFMGSDEWYDSVAKSRPPKTQPWYRVLVDSQKIETYVAERNLMACEQQAINHPLLSYYFTERSDGSYTPRLLPI